MAKDDPLQTRALFVPLEDGYPEQADSHVTIGTLHVGTGLGMKVSTVTPTSSAVGPLIGALAAVAIWGASPSATAIAGRGIPAELIAGLRTVLAGVILLPLFARFRDTFPAGWHARSELIVGAVFGFAIYPLVLSIGVLKTSVTHASIILAAAPIFTGLLTFLITRQWPKPLWWIGSAVALGGVAILMAWRGVSNGGNSATLWGDTLVLVSVLCASIGYVYGGRSAGRMGQWPATAWSIVIGALVFAPFVVPAALAFKWSATTSTELLAVGFLVVFVTIAGYALWFRALADAGAARIAPLQFLQPIVGTALAIAFLGEPLRLGAFVAVVLIILGVWLTRRA
jgi:drug/metabolite transporter (DMT)-like permease